MYVAANVTLIRVGAHVVYQAWSSVSLTPPRCIWVVGPGGGSLADHVRDAISPVIECRVLCKFNLNATGDCAASSATAVTAGGVIPSRRTRVNVRQPRHLELEGRRFVTRLALSCA